MPGKAKKSTGEKKKKRLVLLDAHAIIHRAYHALPDFTSPNGEPTGGLYGLSAMLIRIIGELKPDYIAACFDLPGPTYRHQAYEAYKGTRDKIDEALVSQIKRSREIFKAFNIPCYEKEGFEADDLLGTIVEKLKKEKNIEIVIASGDMDTLQLIDKKNVLVYTMRKGMQDTVLYDEAAVVERFGFMPKLLPDFKGLRGDPSDNIIGIKGIGEKTATTLITTFGTIEAMYKMLKKSDTAFREAGVTPRVIDLLKEGEEEAMFSKELATIRRDAPIAFLLPEKTWRESVQLSDITKIFRELSFRSLIDRAGALLGATTMPLQEAKPEESTAPPDPEAEKRASVLLWILNSEMTNASLDDILSFTKKRSVLDAEAYLFSEVKKQGLLRVYSDIEEPLIPVLERMSAQGIKIDVPYFKKLSKEYHHDLSVIESRIYEYADEVFNINSPKQLGVILFDKLGLTGKNMKKTSTGQRSTRESELEKLRDVHPIIKEILAHRELSKLLGTYIDVLPGVADAEGRVHTTFIQNGAATGRMATQNPGLQNIPIKNELGNNIRNGFITDPGFTLVACDYAQIELKIAAILSNDHQLIDIFKRGVDVHAAVAARMFGLKESEVDHEMRRRAKVINFGILYGMGVNALQQTAGGTRAEAEQYLTQYFKTFKELAEYLERVKGEARKKGYTETYFGRRRLFPSIKSPIPYIRASAERMAINAPMQGTQSDIIKIAMVRIDDLFQKKGWTNDVHMLLQVHDELVFEIKDQKVKEVVPEIKKIMEGVLSLEESKGVPITIETKVGTRWGDLEKMK